MHIQIGKDLRLILLDPVDRHLVSLSKDVLQKVRVGPSQPSSGHHRERVLVVSPWTSGTGGILGSEREVK